MKETIKNLLKVKSIITISLTLVFAVMLIAGLFMPVAIPQEFVMVYNTVIGFYFGTQYQKGLKDDNTGNTSL
jgi:hypothetical protein